MNWTQNTHLITIEQVTETRDSFGASIEVWSEYAQVYAAVKWDRGGEGQEGGRNTATTFATFKVRHDSDTKNVTNKYRISWDGDTWEIDRVLKMGRDDAIEFYAKKKE